MKRLQAAILALCFAAALPSAALAQDDEQGKTPEDLAREAEELARETAKTLMDALQLFINRIPQYESPEILENGDIIIRRKRVPADPPPEREPDDTDTIDSTRT